jgi:hypothetical protein
VVSLLIACVAITVALHAAGWLATAIVFTRTAHLFAPRPQSAVLLGLSLLILDACAGDRRRRRRVVLGALVIAFAAFVFMPLPARINGHDLSGGIAAASSRQQFDTRFRLAEGVVNFHSHLGDVLIGSLDAAFGRTPQSPARAYDAMSRLAGILFLLEIGIAAAWHRWSREVCRYVALTLALPVCLLYFGYWELGYLSVAAGVVPLLALARRGDAVDAQGATLVAGFEQGLHTAGHGFGMMGLAGGALSMLCSKGSALRRLIGGATFVSSSVALYLGWIFVYMTVLGLQVVWARQIGGRPLFEPAIVDRRIASPLFSLDGLGEFGLFSALSGVPLFALAMVTTRRSRLLPAALFSLPSLLFQVRWWPISAPFNLDLLLAVFPGQFAACWALASSTTKSRTALVLIAGLHLLMWTTLGNAMFDRMWIETPP